MIKNEYPNKIKQYQVVYLYLMVFHYIDMCIKFNAVFDYDADMFINFNYKLN